jgi:hypothetical protein
VTEQTLARAHAGDEDALRELTDPYQRKLQLTVVQANGWTCKKAGDVATAS